MKIHSQYTDGNGRVFDVRLEIGEIGEISDANAQDLAERVFASDVVSEAITALGYQDPFSITFVEVNDLTHYVTLT